MPFFIWFIQGVSRIERVCTTPRKQLPSGRQRGKGERTADSGVLPAVFQPPRTTEQHVAWCDVRRHCDGRDSITKAEV